MSQIELRFPSWVGVVCANLAAQRRFYRDVLGFRENSEGNGWVQFEVGQGLTFELVAQSEDPEYDAPRFQVGFSVDDIAEAARELRARGVEPVTEVKTGSDGSSQWAYFRDGEGNVFEITQR
jgi:catechol 2,3-dioxygenase-like lactoylglutathione lyase family enzyme